MRDESSTISRNNSEKPNGWHLVPAFVPTTVRSKESLGFEMMGAPLVLGRLSGAS